MHIESFFAYGDVAYVSYPSSSGELLTIASTESAGAPWQAATQSFGSAAIASAVIGVAGAVVAADDSSKSNAAPEFAAESVEVDVQENSTGSAATVAATDPNGDPLTYTLGGADRSLFGIDSSGELTFDESPNFEDPQDNDDDGIYEVTVTATDSKGASANQLIEITVTNQNEAPVLTVSFTAVNYQENGTGPVDVSINASDVDQGGGLTYSLTGADKDLFTINTITGAIIFNASPNFESPADEGGDNVYNLTINVADTADTPLSDSEDITITVTNDESDDRDPLATVVFDLTQGLSSAHSSRSFDADTTYQIYIIVATDGDVPSLGGDQVWNNGQNLGADDKVTLVGDDGPIMSIDGHAEISTHDLYSYDSIYSPGYLYDWGNAYHTGNWAIYFLDPIGVFNASFSNSNTNRISSKYSKTVTLYSGSPSSFGPQNQTFATAYLSNIPAGLLTSQGLVPA